MSKKKAKSKALCQAADQFGLLPDVKLTKKEKQILHLLAESDENRDIMFLCAVLDSKPSKIAKCLDALIDAGLLEFDDNEDEVCIIITDPGYKYLARTKKEKANQKKFRKFLSCLNKDELDDFFRLCDQFVYEPEFSDEEAETALSNLFGELDESDVADLVGLFTDKVSELFEEAQSDELQLDEPQSDEAIEVPVKKTSGRKKKAPQEKD